MINMKSMTLEIACGDKEYANALAKALWRREASLSFKIEEPEPGSVDELRIREGERVLRMALSDDVSPESIYKYGRPSELLEEIARRYSLFFSKRLTLKGRGGAELIAICSERGGRGKSVCGVALCKVLSRVEGKKVLFSDLSVFESTADFFESKEDDLDLSERKESRAGFFERKDGKADFDSFFYRFISGERLSPEPFLWRDEEGAYYIPPSKGKNRFAESTGNPEGEEVTIKLLSYLADSCGFDYLVFEIGGSFGSLETEVLRRAERILFCEDSPRLLAHLELELGKAAREKSRVLRLPWDRESLSRLENSVHVDIDGELGLELKRFCRNDL